MSGHSKWHSIRRSKGILDQKRGQLFTKLARDITIAAREGGGGDPDGNFRLRIAVDKAKAGNMPAENIQRDPQAEVGVSTPPPPSARRECANIACQLGEQLTALLIIYPLGAANGIHFRMAGHSTRLLWCG